MQWLELFTLFALSCCKKIKMKSQGRSSQCRLLLLPTSFTITNPLKIPVWDPDGYADGMTDVAPLMIIGNSYLLRGKPSMVVPPIYLPCIFMSVDIRQWIFEDGAKTCRTLKASTIFGSWFKVVSHFCDLSLTFLSCMHSLSLFLSYCSNVYKLELWDSFPWN